MTAVNPSGPPSALNRGRSATATGNGMPSRRVPSSSTPSTSSPTPTASSSAVTTVTDDCGNSCAKVRLESSSGGQPKILDALRLPHQTWPLGLQVSIASLAASTTASRAPGGQEAAF